MTERSSQVLLMCEIFRNTCRVVAWIGLESGYSALAMAGEFCNMSAYYALRLMKSFPPNFMLFTFHNIFIRQWFSRVWVSGIHHFSIPKGYPGQAVCPVQVLQEVVLAHEIIIQCGYETTSWEKLPQICWIVQAALYPHIGNFDYDREYPLAGAINMDNARLIENDLGRTWMWSSGHFLSRDLAKLVGSDKYNTSTPPATGVSGALNSGVVGRCSCVIHDADNEFIGLAPAKAREGDVVVVLYGGGVLYVLRLLRAPIINESNENDELYFTLVGEACVHGMMNREALSRTDMGEGPGAGIFLNRECQERK